MAHKHDSETLITALRRMGSRDRDGDGHCIPDVSARLRNLLDYLRRVAQRNNARAKGEIKITIMVDVPAEGPAAFDYKVDEKAPEAPHVAASFYIDRNGDISTEQPTQQKIDYYENETDQVRIISFTKDREV